MNRVVLLSAHKESNMKSRTTRHLISTSLESLETRRLMANFVVTNANDAGSGSLRQAILLANGTTTADVISFNIPTASSKTILPLSDLPAITQPLTIDGSTQPGYSDRPIIELRGTNLVTPQGGLRLSAPATTIKGLAITGFKGNFGSGIQINPGATGAVIQNNHLGVSAFGYFADGNGVYGAHVMEDGATFTGNVIADNDQAGIYFDNVVGGVVRKNIIGATRDGVVELGTQLHGIYAQNADNVLVGSETDAALGNVIMGDQSSIRVQNGTAWSVAGNTLGMNAARTVMYGATSAQISTVSSEDWTIGTGDAPNFIAGTGMYLQNCNNMGVYYNVVGTDITQTKDFGGDFGIWGFSTDNSTFAGNIVGNHDTGLALTGGSDNNVMTSNFIGVSTNPNQRLSNHIGVNIAGNNNDIGTANSRNTIAHNYNKGVVIQSGTGNVILSRVFSNTMINIDLGDDGATGNDGPSDTDTGANNLLNAPYVLNATALANGNTAMHVGLQTSPGTYRVEIYSAMWPDASGKGSGETLLATMNVDVVNPNGWSQSLELTQHIPAGHYISAIATKLAPNGTMVETSEFSFGEEVFGNPEVTGSSFEYEYYHRFEFQFSKNVWNSLQNSDVEFRNIETNQTFTPDGAYIDPTNRIWSVSFSTPLPDGNYTATIDKDGVGDILGRKLVADYTMSFFVLAGDFNRDRTVNFDDLLTLAQSYGKSVQTFSTGDANYDQKVDFSDLLIVAQQYGKTMPAPLVSSFVSTTKRRHIADVIE